jgi:hypothetical protein
MLVSNKATLPSRREGLPIGTRSQYNIQTPIARPTLNRGHNHFLFFAKNRSNPCGVGIATDNERISILAIGRGSRTFSINGGIRLQEMVVILAT